MKFFRLLCFRCVILFSFKFVIIITFPDEELLKNTLQSVAVDNVTPSHMKFLNDRGLPTSSDNDNDVPKINDKSTIERGDPVVNGNEHWGDSTAASALNSSDVRVVRVGRDGFGVKCDGGEACWRPMVTTHWPRLLRHFGYITESRSVLLYMCCKCAQYHSEQCHTVLVTFKIHLHA